ncbi:P1 family peptidase [Streptomyces bohaiensis]|uniref:P1 family peptidase n=1 Tax=Streptomyces bohaiensis TaxID=1431344 RepID=A0ABX1CHY9_9ACTN|nr:P1 family peptidase [Streptomyces bohaiensis]NJQ17748.1 P1 family peptidase [Streptomyces bohaiensis]
MRDALTDVPGLLVGHAERTGNGSLTGVTAVLTPPGGAMAGVDVRGGGPGTRETEALDPRNLVGRADAVVLAGGSAFGLAAADGVMAWLEERDRGFRVGPRPGQVVPVVPAAVLFDLGRGGDWSKRPDAALGRAAAEAASVEVPEGNRGAGAGAVCGGLKGGVGTASLRVSCGATVGALVVVNAVGSVVDPLTGSLHGAPSWRPSPAVREAAAERLAAARQESDRRAPQSLDGPLNTTLAVVATDAVLTHGQTHKLAGTAHDGLARAVRPVHLLTDGDTVFSLATGEFPLPDGASRIAALNEVLAAGADTLSRAVARAVLAAESCDTPGGVFPSYRELYGEPDGADA